MSKQFSKQVIDLRGVSRLLVDAVVGVTELIDAFQRSLSSVVTKDSQENHLPLSRRILRSIQSVAVWTGDKMDKPLALANELLADKTLSPFHPGLLSAVNGVLGDYLVTSENPLAISMQFRKEGIAQNDSDLKTLIEQSNGNFLIMVHGSCLNDLKWTCKGHNHGELLAGELGMTTLYLHYNSGLHISENGQQLSALLHSLNQLSSTPLQLNILAHSMGGLVARSACYYAKENEYSWLEQMKKMIFLGSPHHGAPLEKGGNWVDTLLTKSRFSLPFAPLAKIRSCGITDLRYGNLLDKDWNKNDRFEKSGDQRQPVPLPEKTQCYTVAASTAKQSSILSDHLIGDGLVPLKSALGQHKDSERCLKFPSTHQMIAREIGHMQLLHHADVYKQLKNWMIK